MPSHRHCTDHASCIIGLPSTLTPRTTTRAASKAMNLGGDLSHGLPRAPSPANLRLKVMSIARSLLLRIALFPRTRVSARVEGVVASVASGKM